MIDFKSKIKGKNFEKEINPIRIYSNLDRQASAGPLRPVQESVLNDWYTNHHEDHDVIIKFCVLIKVLRYVNFNIAPL